MHPVGITKIKKSKKRKMELIVVVFPKFRNCYSWSQVVMLCGPSITVKGFIKWNLWWKWAKRTRGVQPACQEMSDSSGPRRWVIGTHFPVITALIQSESSQNPREGSRHLVFHCIYYKSYLMYSIDPMTLSKVTYKETKFSIGYLI